MVSIGERLREERQRLDMSQPVFGEVASVTKKTQMLYESGERFPDAAYLGAVAAAGADVQYIVTGERSDMALTPEERLMLDRYRACTQPLRDAALRVLIGGDAPPSKTHGQMTFHATVGSVTKVEGDLSVGNQRIEVGSKPKKK